MVKVALDIGHGSNTFPPSKGVYKGGKGYAEHDFNSKLTVAIDKLLKKSGISTIIYQKPNKADIGLTKRTNYYNSKNVDLVYSIHANYNADPAVNGRCVFYWHTSKASKRMADIVVSEIKKAGYSTHGDGFHASKPGSWTNLHICRETNAPSVLVENGFMGGSSDFELVFGSKQNEYIKNMAVVHAKAISKFLGVVYKGGKGVFIKRPTTSKDNNQKVNKNVSLVDYLNSRGLDSSFNNRGKLATKYNISNYKGSAKQNTDLLNALKGQNKAPSKPKGKSISTLAKEVIDGVHGNGHANRRKSLGISKSEYGKVRNIVNNRPKNTSSGKSISKMVDEVIAGKHGNGHANRRKSLGISSAQYTKVREAVNKGGQSTKSVSTMAKEIIDGKHGNGHSKRRKSLGISNTLYNKVKSEVNKRM